MVRAQLVVFCPLVCRGFLRNADVESTSVVSLTQRGFSPKFGKTCFSNIAIVNGLDILGIAPWFMCENGNERMSSILVCQSEDKHT